MSIRMALFTPFLYLLYFVLRAISPLVCIRFGVLSTKRIGAFVMMTDEYLRKKSLGLDRPRTWNILTVQSYVSNEYLVRKWSQHLFIVRPNRLLSAIVQFFKARRNIPAFSAHLVPMRGHDPHKVYYRTETFVTFTDSEREDAARTLETNGIPRTSDYVCLHVRSADYLKNNKLQDQDYSIHNHRDCTLDNFRTAVEYLSASGTFSLHFGTHDTRKMATTAERYIDYANTFRSEFLDVYLAMNCRFFISTHSGPDVLASIAKRPVLWTNNPTYRLMMLLSQHDVYLFKKLWSTKEKRFLSLREVASWPELAGCVYADKFKQMGIEPIENSSEEILDATVEINQRIAGTYQEHPENQARQEKFYELIRPCLQHGLPDIPEVIPHVSEKFLINNPWFLE